MNNSDKNLTPREIVAELEHYIIGQAEAKRAVAIAMRNRWRRQKVADDLRDEIAPKNIIMIGPTGVGKTEIARRLAKLANAPFIKVEASKFTEVGYVGKDVESMIRELMDVAVNIVKTEEEEKVLVKAGENAEERLLDLLLPKKPKPTKKTSATTANDTEAAALFFDVGLDSEKAESDSEGDDNNPEDSEEDSKTRDKLKAMLKEGKLDSRSVDIDPPSSKGSGMPMIEVVSAGGSLDDIGKNIRDMFSNFMPRSKKRRKVKVPEALSMLKEEEAERLVDMDDVLKKAIDKVEQGGIIFIDEIDKISSREKNNGGAEVSREGVQRDILPIVEGSRVSTKYGMVCTDHILFIAAGAFHVSKPSDLIPELQGRFPIRVELESLTVEDFLKILTQPRNALVTQYIELMKTEKVELEFTDEALKQIAHFAQQANEQMENIGARRLHTIMEKVLDELSFDADEKPGQKVVIDDTYVKTCLEPIVKNQDLSRYIL